MPAYIKRIFRKNVNQDNLQRNNGLPVPVVFRLPFQVLAGLKGPSHCPQETLRRRELERVATPVGNDARRAAAEPVVAGYDDETVPAELPYPDLAVSWLNIWLPFALL